MPGVLYEVLFPDTYGEPKSTFVTERICHESTRYCQNVTAVFPSPLPRYIPNLT